MVATGAVRDVYTDEDDGDENAPTKVGRLAGVMASGLAASGERPVAGASDSGSRARVGFATTFPLTQASPVALARGDVLDRTDKTALMPSAAAAVFARADGRLDPSVLLGVGPSFGAGAVPRGVGPAPSPSAIVRAAPLAHGANAPARFHIRAELAPHAHARANGRATTSRNLAPPPKPSSTLAFLALTLLGLGAGVFFAALFDYLVLS
jgi:hypothetical protein